MSSPVDWANARSAGARYDGNKPTVVLQWYTEGWDSCTCTNESCRTSQWWMWERCAASVLHAYWCMSGKHCRIFPNACAWRLHPPSSAREPLEFLVWIKDFPTQPKQCKSPGQPHVTCLSLWFKCTNTYAGTAQCFYILQLIAVTSCLRAQKEQRHKSWTAAARLTAVWVNQSVTSNGVRSGFYYCPDSKARVLAKNIKSGNWGTFESSGSQLTQFSSCQCFGLFRYNVREDCGWDLCAWNDRRPLDTERWWNNC